MSLAYVSCTIDADVDAVWAVLGDFHGLPRWIARIRASESENGSGPATVGSVRRLTLEPDGQTARERLIGYDAPGRRYSYEFADEIPFPVSTYRGTVHALPITETGTTFLEWYGEFDCEHNVLDEVTAVFPSDLHRVHRRPEAIPARSGTAVNGKVRERTFTGG
ncbi:SRPBCC family protein [Mycobacterium kiyosense]|nr:hypothetical protein IWGMT90018_45390 [Mycobacterium kiyosense]